MSNRDFRWKIKIAATIVAWMGEGGEQTPNN